MGRKKKKQLKPWCWYCNREFDDEKILIQHQKSKHFKCSFCHKKLYTGPGLSIHSMQVHKEKIDKIPFALPHRSNVDIEIYGMEGIPDEDLRDHEKHKIGKDDEPEEKRIKVDVTVSTPFTSTNMGLSAPVPFMTTIHLPMIPSPVPMNLGPQILVTRPTLQVPGMMPHLNTITNPVPVSPFLPIRNHTISAPVGYNHHHLVHDIPPPPPPPPIPIIKNKTPTFPAYSGAYDTEKIVLKVSKPTSSTPNVKVILVHPEDDIPLEQIRLRSKKYSYIKNIEYGDVNSNDTIINNEVSSSNFSLQNINLPVRPWPPITQLRPPYGHY